MLEAYRKWQIKIEYMVWEEAWNYSFMNIMRNLLEHTIMMCEDVYIYFILVIV